MLFQVELILQATLDTNQAPKKNIHSTNILGANRTQIHSRNYKRIALGFHELNTKERFQATIK